MPQRNVKGKAKPPALIKTTDTEAEGNSEFTEADIKFDNEVLWCISQFEKILSSGKLPEQKKLESIKAMNTLRKNVPKIKKAQLMRQYFKDLKAKMAKDEELVKSQAPQNFMVAVENESFKGVFVKKKHMTSVTETTAPFLFNFQDPTRVS